MLRKLNGSVCLLVLVAACGTDNADNPLADAPSCQSLDDCGSEQVCLTQPGGAICTPICTGRADECGAEASCGGVGVLSVNACQPKPSPSEPPKPEEQPRVPCKTDAECRVLSPVAICAQFRGLRDCTLPCNQESECDMPAVAGVSVDFMTCIPDQGQTSRNACLPDERCFNDPFTCITTMSFGGFGGI